MLEINTIHSFDTEYSADSIEWCHAEGFRDLFVLGTYQLEEKDADVSANNVRKGRIYLFQYDNVSKGLEKLQQIETDAILDQKWNGKCLVTVTSLGSVQTYELSQKGLLELKSETNINADGGKSLALSVDLIEGSSRTLVR